MKLSERIKERLHGAFAVRLARSVRAFGKNERGNIAIIFAITAPVAIGAVVTAITYSNGNNTKSGLQAALDSAANALESAAGSISSALSRTRADSAADSSTSVSVPCPDATPSAFWISTPSLSQR